MNELLTIAQAAARLNVPKASLRRVVEGTEFLIRLGPKTLRIADDDIGRIIELCREKPRARASTSAATKSSTSATPTDRSTQRALETAARLKKPLPATSPPRTAQLVRIHPKA